MENTDSDEVEKLKSKFVSAWYTVKYSWMLKTKTRFSRNSPVFLLGKCYHFKAEDEEASMDSISACTSEKEFVLGNVDAFQKDFTSRIWLTYREEFPQIQGSSFTSDCGWGCTLRTGQMLLAQALVIHFLGRNWTWSEALKVDSLHAESWTVSTARKFVNSVENSFHGERSCKSDTQTQSLHQDEAGSSLDNFYHRHIISWFSDVPKAQFGLHRLVEHGHASGKTAGDWYGPAVVAHILRKAVEESTDPELQGITVYVAQDCTVYSGDVIDSHRKSAKGSGPRTSTRTYRSAVIILIPVRLGGEKTNPEYFDFVKGILSLEYCIGIIGGIPKQAYYFVGFQDDSLIYMDPHYCQSFVDVSTKDFSVESFHCPSPKKIPFTKMDPSCTIGFYSRNEDDFERISEEISKVLKSTSKEKYPAFTFVKGHGHDNSFLRQQKLEKSQLSVKREQKLSRQGLEDYVLL
ncbi:cysteine protease ATG4C [Polypterus senegalus]